MAGYGYNTYSGMESHSDDGWRKSSSDHVCRPVIIDAEGRKQPIIRYTGTNRSPLKSAETYVTKTETYVEHVHSPMNYTRPMPEDPYDFNQQQGQILRMADHNRPKKVEFSTNVQTEAYSKPSRTSPFSTMVVSPPEDIYEFNKQQGQSLRMADHNRPQKVEEFSTKVQTETYSKPSRTAPFSTVVVSPPEDPYESNKQQGQNLRMADQNWPQKVEEFITKIQTEASNKPTRTSPFSTTTYRRPTGTDYTTTTGYGDYNDEYNNNNNNGGYGQYNHRDKPNRTGYWSTPPTEARERAATNQLTKPTNDISTAIEYLKEAATIAKPFLGNNGGNNTAAAATNLTKPRFTIGVPPPRRSDYATTTKTTSMETISSSEAKKRYGNPSSPMPFTTGERDNYDGTIDSREAMRRYNGRVV